MTPATRDPLVRVSVATGGLLLLVMVAATVPAQTPAAQPVTEPLAAASAYCAPGPGQSGVAALATTGTTPGSIALGALAPGTEEPATESGAGFTPTASVDADRPLGAWVPPSQVTGVLGTEGGAAGLTVSQVSQSGAGDAVGLAELVCPAAGTEFWFVGGGSDVGRRTVLELVNPDPTAAAVDVQLFTGSGLAEPVAGQGVPVPGGGRTSVRLDQLAPGEAALALHVTARSGRVSAGLFDLAIRGAQPQGIDWVPPSVPPGTNLVVPGVFALPDGESELLLAAPGERTASVQVEVVAADGAFIPVGLDSVEVPAGGLAAVPLTELVGRADVGLLLTADEPVLAGVRLRAGGSPPDFAYATATPALTGPAAAPANNPEVAARLSVVAPGDATTVEVTVVDAEGRRTTSQLAVAARSSATLSVAAPAGAYSILVTAGTEPVHVARLSSAAVNESVFVTAVPLTSRPDSVTLPAAPADPGAGLPGR